MSNSALSLFVGPAVVVDDEVDDTNTTARAVVAELEGAHFPVLRRRMIPPDEEVAHWQAMSLIVLDWDLLGTISIAPDGEDLIEGDDSSLLGMTFPDSLRQNLKTDSRRFVRKLMKDLYCPIFIISNHDVESIWTQLQDGLDEDEIQQLKARTLVRSKTQDAGSLLESLDEWIVKHPAVYALKTWERGYERAKATLFTDFQRSAIDWPGILWRNSSIDGVNPNHDLTETISRNLLHRMDPNLFSADLILSTEDSNSLDSVRRVLHQHAVLPVERLHRDVIMPGDFFFEEAPNDQEDAEDDTGAQDEQTFLPQTIDICLTPACDLVARNQAPDGVKMFMVRSSLVTDAELSSKKAIKRLLDSSESTTFALLHHLVPEDAMYRVRFGDWFVTTWGEVRNRRRGRLLDPYVTLLQQRHALFSQRQGLPRLPDDFYKPRPVSG